MNWFEVATFEPYLYYCPRSYQKVSSLFNRAANQHITPQDYEKQPRAYFRKLLLMGLNANSFQQDKMKEDNKAVAQMRHQNKALKQKAKSLLSTVEDNQREIDLKKKKLKKSTVKTKQPEPYSLSCPICDKPIDSKQQHLQHFKMHMHTDQPGKNKSNQLLELLLEQQKLLLSQSSVALKKHDIVPDEKQRHLEHLIKKSQQLINVLSSCKQESMQRSIQISDHLLRLQRYQFDRRSSEMSKNQSRIGYQQRAIIHHTKQPRTEDKLCFFQPDQQGLIKLTEMIYSQPKMLTHSPSNKSQSQYSQGSKQVVPQQIIQRSRTRVQSHKSAILEEHQMIRQYGTDSSYSLPSHPSTIRIRCREEDFMFDQSKVQLFTSQPQYKAKPHQMSQSVDFTISNDSSSRMIQRHQNFKPSLIIEDESKLWSRSYK